MSNVQGKIKKRNSEQNPKHGTPNSELKTQMKVTYLGHATLVVEIEGVKILTDPWVVGAAYCDQWYLFPKPPADALEYLKDVDYVLITHGHEDHLHPETLSHVNKNAHVFFPYTWYEGATGFFKELGFKKITEAVNERIYSLTKNIRITFLANNLDNILVIESKDKVLVNINDALPSAPQGIISAFIDKINSKWKHVDYLFSSYGGASYFPNTIKFKEKNDLEVGLVREQFFLENFCKIAQGVNADYSIPFASDFVLLDDDQRWINKAKVARSEIKDYLETYFPLEKNTSIIEFYPGDKLDDGKFSFLSPYHEKLAKQDLASLAELEYSEEIKVKQNAPKISKQEFEKICDNVKQHVNRKAGIVPAEKQKLLKFAILITDYDAKSFIEIDLRHSPPSVVMTNELKEDNVLLMKVKSATLLYSLNNEWGGDAIIIGYGCELTIFKKETILQQLENYAIHLLTNYPNTKEYIKKNPFRTFNYLAHDKMKRKIFLGKLTGKKASSSPFTDARLADNEMWLTRSNCEICRKCNLPILTEENTAVLK